MLGWHILSSLSETTLPNNICGMLRYTEECMTLYPNGPRSHVKDGLLFSHRFRRRRLLCADSATLLEASILRSWFMLTRGMMSQLEFPVLPKRTSA